MTVDDIVRLLGLEPHPTEGGYFVETHRTAETVPSHALPDRYEGERAHGTAIYYLLTPDTFSALHRLTSDEVFHFYIGDPVEQLQLFPGGEGRMVVLGTDLAAGHRPQQVVPRDVWQGARLAEGGRFALMGCTVAPGFDFEDYEHGERAGLTADYPDFAAEIARLTAD